MMRMDLLSPGTILGGEFTVMNPLDKGGMGAVYVVLQRSTEKLRALKIMHREIAADPALARRFEQEARVGARIESEHVVEVIAAGTDPTLRVPYLVMELLEGEDLRHWMRAHGPMGPGTVRTVFEQLCHAMAAAHAAGVVHRDLKPENVFLAKSRRAGDAPFTVKVLDFGIAKLVQDAHTRATHGTIGSPLWMAPEQTATGPVTAAADTWALGLIAYHLLTGSYFWRSAREGTTIQLLREIVFEPIARASVRAREEGLAERLPPAFDSWFERCVTREPSARFPDAKSLWQAMKSLLASPDAFAETFAARGAGALLASETADASPYRNAKPILAPPIEVPKETPISIAQGTPLPEAGAGAGAGAGSQPRRTSPVVIGSGLAIAIAGAMGGWLIARRPNPSVPAAPVASPQVLSTVSAPTAPASTAPAPSASASSAPIAESSAPIADSGASATPSAQPQKPRNPPAERNASTANRAPAANKNGFLDPIGPDPRLTQTPAVMTRVQDHPIRLFSRIVKNDSNVADIEVRTAIDHFPWGYLKCYERILGGAKELPEGVVTVAFEIDDQLPRRGTLESSTLDNDAFNQCIVQRLLGQTINAAGPEGKGHVVYAFRFKVMD